MSRLSLHPCRRKIIALTKTLTNIALLLNVPIYLPLKSKNQLDANYYFIVLLMGSPCFGHYYAHHQELATIMLITTLQCFNLQNGHFQTSSAANPNTQRSQNKATDVVNRQYSRRLLKMNILMFETC